MKKSIILFQKYNIIILKNILFLNNSKFSLNYYNKIIIIRLIYIINIIIIYLIYSNNLSKI